MSVFFRAVERLSIVAADLVLVPILALWDLSRSLRGEPLASFGTAKAQGGPDSRPSARPRKT